MKYQKIIGLLALVLVVGVAGYALHARSQSALAGSVAEDTDTDENSANPYSYAAAVSLAVGAPEIKYQVSSSTPQFVLLSFDGSKSVPMLDETLDFQREMTAKGKPLHFTYFINASYFLTKDTAASYQAPG
jgi:hypothetical protein